MANLPPTPSSPPIGPPFGPPIRPPYTAVMAMNSCGFSTANQYQTFENEEFMDEFESYKDISK